MAVRKALATAYAGHLFRYGCILILIPFYARVLGQPDIGGYTWNARWKWFQRASVDCQRSGTQLNVCLGKGRYFGSVYQGGLSGIEGANPAAFRWRYISSRSPNGVIGDAATASPEKGEKLLAAIEGTREILGIPSEGPVLVAGSTHPGEEDIILASFHKCRSRFSDARLVLVPRHPERFETVWQLLLKTPYAVRRISNGEFRAAPGTDGPDIVLVDKMGLLAERIVESMPVAFQRSAGIDVARRAVLAGNVGDSNVFGMELPVAVFKMIHELFRLFLFCFCIIGQVKSELHESVEAVRFITARSTSDRLNVHA